MATPDNTRDKVASRFAKTLESESLGKQLEIVLWNDCIRRCMKQKIPLKWTTELKGRSFRQVYTNRAIGLDMYNLQTNDTLRQNIQRGDLPLKKFISMTPYEMNPELWNPVFERVAYKALRKQLTVDVENAPDGAFTCNKCKSKKTSFYQLQTRSADEPMTCFIQCLSCGKRWKQ
jgi:DNA-directed RNA polymerase subunit M/transcription elongation factor TFIIS